MKHPRSPRRRRAAPVTPPPAEAPQTHPQAPLAPPEPIPDGQVTAVAAEGGDEGPTREIVTEDDVNGRT